MTEPMKTIEPVTTFFEDGKVLRILTELPGIAEEKIRIDLDSSSTLLTIVASDTERQYKKVINIPSEVKFNYKRFSDGVLELTLGKK
jgi:HSP20 family molecular chaperone IbpA